MVKKKETREQYVKRVAKKSCLKCDHPIEMHLYEYDDINGEEYMCYCACLLFYESKRGMK